MKRFAFLAFAALLGLSATALSTTAQPATRTAVFAGGCFWSVEKFFEGAPGVVRAVSGYSGGAMNNPIYGDHEGHLEAVQVTYDPARTSYAKLVDHFFRNIDPTDPNGQICDLGPSYRTAIFVASPEERQVAEAAKARVATMLKRTVATQVRPGMKFWPGESYHQDFAKKNPMRYEAYRIGCGRDRRLKAVWGGR